MSDSDQAAIQNGIALSSADISEAIKKNDDLNTSIRQDEEEEGINNPLWKEQNDFLQSLSFQERTGFFSNHSRISSERRAALWMQQADLGSVDRYAWATPDRRALQILHHFCPLIEIGCGARAYWCRQMIARYGTDSMVGFDVAPLTGGTIAASTKREKRQRTEDNKDWSVQLGGPEVLSLPEHRHRTLFLCYPDENDGPDPEYSLAADCLQRYTGDIVIHVGELMSLSTPIRGRDTAPYGRSSAPEFQERLFSEFHCLLQVALPNWLHAQDTLTVWKRSTDTTTIVFDNENENPDGSDEPDGEDDEVVYRHIPLEERLPVDMAAPCLRHLL